VLTSLKNIFKVHDLRNKVLFTLLVIVIYRLGAHVPVPGIAYDQVQELRKQSEQSGTLGFLNLFSGGALTQFSVFALGIMPYITASIIIQILGVVIPKLEQWQNQGAVGQRKITQWTRYLAIMIAFVQGTGLTYLFGTGRGGSTFFGSGAPSIQLLPDTEVPRVLLVVLTLVAGTALLMWMGELITQRGIGNGMSVLIFCSVVSGLPYGYYRMLKEGKVAVFVILVLISLGTLVAIVFVENGQRRIPVQFAKRVVGRRMYGGQSTYIPLKVNQAGIIPIIFASSILFLPTLLGNLFSGEWYDPVRNFVDDYVINQTHWVHLLLLFFLILGFAYFYVAIAFDPVKQADSIRKQGGFIPGIRPGPQTERYLQKVLNRITLPGAIFLAFIAILPNIVLFFSDITYFPLGGTTVLIAVGVALETMKQIDSQLMMRNYEGFLK
jgi:preprotein translocase subunit SecY